MTEREKILDLTLTDCDQIENLIRAVRTHIIRMERTLKSQEEISEKLAEEVDRLTKENEGLKQHVHDLNQDREMVVS